MNCDDTPHTICTSGNQREFDSADRARIVELVAPHLDRIVAGRRKFLHRLTGREVDPLADVKTGEAIPDLHAITNRYAKE